MTWRRYRFALAVPEGISTRGYFAGLMGPLFISAGLAIQLLLTGVLVAKPPAVDRSRLTDYGVFYFTPDRDVPLYLAAVVIFVALGAALIWAWNRRLVSRDPPASGAFLMSSFLFQVEASVGGTALYVYLFLRARIYLLQGRLVPSKYLAVFALIGLGSLAVALLGWMPGRKSRAGSRVCVLLDGIRGTEPSRTGFSPLDFAVPLIIVAVVYVTAWRQLAGRVFYEDGFFHWDFFAMGPALAYRHGRALGSEIFSMYGLGWPAFYGALSRWIPLSYGRMIQIASIYSCIYMTGIYMFLRLLVRRPVVAALGTGLVLLQFFVMVETVIWRFPSLTVLRWGFDVWCFIALLLHWRSGRRIWAVFAGAFVGLAIFFVTDTGLYLSAAVAFYWLVTYRISSDKKRYRFDIAGSVAAAVVALLAGMMIAARGEVFSGGFWRGWLESLLEYGGGFAQVPLATGPETLVMVWFVVLFFAYLAIFGYLVERLLHNRAQYLEIFNGFLALYGMLILLHFVGRSGESLYRVWIPLALILANLGGAAVNQAGSLARQIWGDTHRSRAALRAACAAAGLMSILLVVVAPRSLVITPFLNYPNTISLLMGEKPTDGVCLMNDPKDICALRSTLVDAAASVQSIVRQLRSYKQDGKTLAVIDDSGALFYLAADSAPFGRYSRLFTTLLTKQDLREFENLLRSNPPDIILTRPAVILPSRIYEKWQFASFGASLPSDTLNQLRTVVTDLYQLESTTEPYEIWSRRQSTVSAGS